MPNTSSAKKALRVSRRKQKTNKVTQYKINNALKELRRAIANKSKDYKEILAKVYSSLDKAVKSNYIPKKRADRKKSRVMKMVAKAQEKK